VIRVLEVLASLRRAGAESVAVSLACGLDPKRFEAAVVSLYGTFEGGFEPVLAGHGIPAWHLDKRRGFDPRMWPRLAAVMRRFRPDIVHTHSYVMRYAWPSRVLAGPGRIVHTVHNVADREVDSLGRAIHRLAFRAGAVPVAISTEVARSFRAVYGFGPAAVIPNGVDTRAMFRPEARDTWRRDHGFAPCDLLVVSVARLDPQKNPAGTIEAFARAFGDRESAHLVWAGAGSLLEATRRTAAALGIERRVHFIGLCDDVAALLSAGDIFLLASAWEGSPVAVIEAMAAALPVVATAVGGVPELVEHGVTGLLAAPGDIQALAEALAALARDPARRHAMGEAAAARAARLDSAAMVEAYAALFEKLCGGRQ
jgi:glycosyltransferase involved in cell wall biosynthesis